MRGDRRAKLDWLTLLRGSESGSALVETALALPLLVALLLGAVEMGDLAYKATEISNGARAAAQYAAMNGGNFTDCNGSFAGGTCNSGSGIVAAAQQDAPRTVATCTSFTVGVTSSCSCSDTTGTCSSAGNTYACSSGKPIVTVTVTTSAQCSPAASLFPGAFTLYGSAQQEVLQ